MKSNLINKFLTLFLAMLGMTLYADTTSIDYVNQIERAPLFPSPLIWVGGTKPPDGESQVLCSDVTAFQTGGIDAGLDGLEQFLQDYPNSAWAPSLHVNMAEYYRAHGRYSLALKHWEAAWDYTKKSKDPATEKIAARTLAGWTRLLGTLGQKEKLHTIFAEMNTLNLPLGTYATPIQETEEGLNIMDAKPGISYRCGSFALGNMAIALHLDQSIPRKLFQVDSPDGGFNISELLTLAKTNGMAVEAVRRPPGADLVVPSVVHWKLNHYAAITEKKGDLYKVEDPTFAGHVWMTAATIEAESSGEFILPKDKVPADWQQLSASECAGIYGKGYGNLISDILDLGYFCDDGDIDLSGNDMPWGACYDPTKFCGGGGCNNNPSLFGIPGMPEWYVSEPYITLWLYDSPIPYYQSDGNAMELKLSYKSRGNPQIENGTISGIAGFGDDWICNWIGMLQYVGGQDTITDFRAGGGEETFNTNGTPDYETARMFEYVPIGTSNYPALVTAKGEKDIYGFTMPTASATTNYFLTETIDQFGRVLKQFKYQNAGGIIQLTSVIDMDGRTNTLAYGITAFPEIITDVTNAYGRTAHFYYNTNGLHFTITNMVDAQEMSSSFQYDQGENITNMITPYGTTSFEYFSNLNTNNQNAVTRAILITEPTGDHELYVYEDDAQIDPDNQFDKVSLHWNRQQYQNITDGGQTNFMLLSTADFAYAPFKQWLHGDNNTNNPIQAGWTLSDTLSQKADPYDVTVGPHGERPNWIVYTNMGETNMLVDGFNELYTGDTNGGLKQVASISFENFYESGPAVSVTRNVLGLVTSYSDYIFDNGSSPLAVAVYSNNYDASGTIVQNEIGPSGETVFGYSYTTNSQNPGITNLLVAVTNAVGYVTRYTHDSNTLRLTSTIFPSGLMETNVYYTSGPNEGFLAMQADVGIRTNYFAYTNGNLSVETNALGLVTTYAYDNLNRLVSTTYPDGTTESNIYNNLDIVATKDRLNQWTHYGYNSLRQLLAVTNANGQVTTYDYCGCGSPDQIVQIDGANQYTNSFDYNMGGLLMDAVYPDGYSLSYTYDGNNNLQTVTDGYNNQWNTHDITQIGSQFTPTFIQINGGPLLSLTLDEYGRILSRQNYHDGIVTNGYDFLGRIVARQLLPSYAYDPPETGLESFGYGPAGLTNYIDQLGNATIFVRDNAGRILYETNANLEVLKYTYSAADEPLALTDGNNHTTTWIYDQFGRITDKIDAAGTTNAFEYDPLGRLTNRWTTAKGTTVYRYDPIGNLTNIDYSLGTVSTPSIYYAYDGLNRMASMVDGSGTNVFTWTPGNQLASETGPWSDDTISNTYNAARQRSGMVLSEPNGPAWAQIYGYDQNMQLTNVISPADNFTLGYSSFYYLGDQLSSLQAASYAGYSLSFSHDFAAVLNQVTMNRSAIFSYYYDGGLEVTQEDFMRGNYINYNYDNIHQLKVEQGFEQGGTPSRLQEQFGYAYDNAGNLIQRTNNALIQTFIINNLNELTNASRTGTFTVVGDTTELPGSPYWGIPGVTNVAVNGNGANLYGDGTFAATGFTLTNGNNAFTAIAEDTYGRSATNTVTAYLPATPAYKYDANGNLTNDGTRNFAYDDENELVGAWVANTWSNSFVYDGMWRKRIERDYAWNGSSWLQTNEVHFIYDGNRVLQERDANNLPQITYTWGTTANRVLQGDRVGGLLARTENSKLAIGAPFSTAYYINDRNGNVMYLMYSNNLPAAAYEYDPFGNILGMSGTLAGANRYRFSGKEWNNGAGLYYYGRRFYDPSLQRWLNRDPIQELGGINLYGFVSDDPIGEIDALGLDFAPNISPPKTWSGPYLNSPGSAGGPAAGSGAEAGELGLGAEAGLFAAGAGEAYLIGEAIGVSRDAEHDPNGVNAIENATSPMPMTATLMPPPKPPCNTKVTSGFPGDENEDHHRLPRQFELYFNARGLKIEDYTTKMPMQWHRGAGISLHSNGYNNAWENFIAENPNADSEDILLYLYDLENSMGFGILPP
jgi:RHS repeat-associated protein